MRIVLKYENDKRARGERKEIIGGNPQGADAINSNVPVFSSVEEAKMELGDMWSGFKYAL